MYCNQPSTLQSFISLLKLPFASICGYCQPSNQQEKMALTMASTALSSLPIRSQLTHTLPIPFIFSLSPFKMEYIQLHILAQLYFNLAYAIILSDCHWFNLLGLVKQRITKKMFHRESFKMFISRRKKQAECNKRRSFKCL